MAHLMFCFTIIPHVYFCVTAQEQHQHLEKARKAHGFLSEMEMWGESHDSPVKQKMVLSYPLVI